MKSLNNLLTFLALSIIAILNRVQSLTAEEAAGQCHCDLTESFCDFDCCCDLDCSSTVSDSCFNYRSAQICIDSAFYYKINPMDSLVQTGTQDCYYFNITTQLQEEVTLSNWQLKYFASQLTLSESLSSDVVKMHNGYEPGIAMTIGGVQSFYLVDANGDCIGNGMTGNYAKSIKFGENFDITCSSSSNNINLFTKFSGKKVPKYFLDDTASNTLLLPSLSGTFTSATIYFIISTYGSQNALFIQSIQGETSNSSGSTTKTLRFRFIYPEVNFEAQVEDPSFFPQIPYDIFYPIHQFAASF